MKAIFATMNTTCAVVKIGTQQQQHIKDNMILTKVMEYLFLGSWITTR